MFSPVVLVLSSDSDEEVVAITSPLPTRRSRPLPTPAHGGSNQLSKLAHATASAVSEAHGHARSSNVHSVGGPSQAPWIWVSGDDCELLGFTDDATAAHSAAVQAVVPWTDPAFPPCAESINGPARAPKESATTSYIACRCGVPAAKSIVQSDLNGNKGRPYHHCKTRCCQFFAWADGSSISRSYVWRRLPNYVVVTDFGFSPNDLLQGGVGDCWFLSALAVVAQRHDLIARLFVDTAPARSGCYLLRLFLDGQWRHVVVDDQLPCIPNPNRAHLAGEVGLAFSRTSNQQLWVCLLEKAYAKAHGSYHAISGGEISEALVDLCGMPTHTLHFDSPNFNLQDLWTQLLRYKRLGCPMGCATGGGKDLRQVGLSANHAYSIVDAREVTQMSGDRVQLVRIRNPHGQGEWNGDWSDTSSQWASVIHDSQQSQEIERSAEDDGCFWMELTKFVQGFSLVDVCLAHKGWHSRSFPNSFCTLSCPWRVCKEMLRVRCTQPGTLYVMALQPSPRGASIGRGDRKKSYKLGDVSVVVLQITRGGDFVSVVGGGFHGSEGRSRCTFQAKLPSAEHDYLVVAFNMAQPPTAAESSSQPPFILRLCSSSTLQVQPQEFSAGRGHGPPLLHALHKMLLHLSQQARSTSFAEHEGARSIVERHEIMDGIDVLHIDCDGFLLFFALNARDAHVQVTVRTSAKMMSVRCVDGILKDDPALALKPPFNEQIVDSMRKTPPSAGLRFEAKWKVYGTSASLPPQSQRLLLVMSPRGNQSHAGRIVFDAGETVFQPLQHRPSIRSWLGGAGEEARHTDATPFPVGIFDSQPLDEEFFRDAGRRAVNDGMQVAVEQSIIQAAIDQSKAEEQLLRVMLQAQEEEEARQLKIALALSQQEDRELQTVIQRSQTSRAGPAQPVVQILSSDDESVDVSSRGNAVDCSSLYAMGFAEAVVKNALEFANGNLDEALELLLNGLEPSSADMVDDHASARQQRRHQATHQELSNVWNDAIDIEDDVLIMQDQSMPGTKTSRTKRLRPVSKGPTSDSEGDDDLLSSGQDQVHDIGHIFVDQSNIGVSEPDIPAVDWIISQGVRSCHERVVVGSQTEAVGRGTFEQAWKALGYSAHFQQKRRNQPESFVDETLVAHVQRALLRHSPEGRIIVLVTGDGNANHGKPNFLEVVTQALRRQWRVKLVCKKNNVSKAYKRLINNELFCIQHIYPDVLERARVRVASLSHQQRPRTPCSGHQSSHSEAPLLPAPVLSAEALRAARLKFFNRQQGGAAADASDDLQTDALVVTTGGTAPMRTPCFDGLKFALYQLQWGSGDSAHTQVANLIRQNGGQVSASLRESGVTHIICNSAVYSDDMLAAIIEGRNGERPVPAVRPSWLRECVDLGRVVEDTSPQHTVRPSQIFKGLSVCLHQISPVMQPGKMEEALVARGAAVTFQVHEDSSVLVTSLSYWDSFVSEAQAAHPHVMAVSSIWVLQSMAQGTLLPQLPFKIPQIRSSISSDSFYGKSPSKV